MKKILLLITVLMLGTVGFAQSVDPITQISWPLTTGSGTPSLSCTSLSYGMPYTDLTHNAFYICQPSGWLELASVIGSATWPTSSGILSYNTGSPYSWIMLSVSGTGPVALTTSPSFTTPLLGDASASSLTATGSVSASFFSGLGTSLTGTASGLNIGGNAASATTATTATNLGGGIAYSLPFQSSSGNTTFLSGNATTTPNFYTSTGNGASAQAPSLTSSTGSGGVVLNVGPSITSPVISSPTFSGTFPLQAHHLAFADMSNTVYTGSQVIAEYISPVAQTLSNVTALGGISCSSQAQFITPNTSSIILQIKVGTSLTGTVTIGANNGTVVFSGFPTPITAGQIISVVAPSSADDTAAGLIMSICSFY